MEIFYINLDCERVKYMMDQLMFLEAKEFSIGFDLAELVIYENDLTEKNRMTIGAFLNSILKSSDIIVKFQCNYTYYKVICSELGDCIISSLQFDEAKKKVTITFQLKNKEENMQSIEFNESVKDLIFMIKDFEANGNINSKVVCKDSCYVTHNNYTCSLSYFYQNDILKEGAKVNFSHSNWTNLDKQVAMGQIQNYLIHNQDILELYFDTINHEAVYTSYMFEAVYKLATKVYNFIHKEFIVKSIIDIDTYCKHFLINFKYVSNEKRDKENKKVIEFCNDISDLIKMIKDFEKDYKLHSHTYRDDYYVMYGNEACSLAYLYQNNILKKGSKVTFSHCNWAKEETVDSLYDCLKQGHISLLQLYFGKDAIKPSPMYIRPAARQLAEKIYNFIHKEFVVKDISTPGYTDGTKHIVIDFKPENILFIDTNIFNKILYCNKIHIDSVGKLYDNFSIDMFGDNYTNITKCYNNINRLKDLKGKKINLNVMDLTYFCVKNHTTINKKYIDIIEKTDFILDSITDENIVIKVAENNENKKEDKEMPIDIAKARVIIDRAYSDALLNNMPEKLFCSKHNFDQREVKEAFDMADKALEQMQNKEDYDFDVYFENLKNIAKRINIYSNIAKDFYDEKLKYKKIEIKCKYIPSYDKYKLADFVKFVVFENPTFVGAENTIIKNHNLSKSIFIITDKKKSEYGDVFVFQELYRGK